MSATLLVELLTEELPPKSLARLGKGFAELLSDALGAGGFVTSESKVRWYATPRRLAVTATAVREVAPDAEILAKGPSVKAGIDAEGKPTAALLGFAKKRGVGVDTLVRVTEGKQEVFAHRDLVKGGSLDASLASHVEEALKRLPIPKLMRWGSGDAQFVRPVHGLVMLCGSRVVPGSVLGIAAGNVTRGHRFMGASSITLASAEDYGERLRTDGKVIADYEERKAQIERALQAAAAREGGVLGQYRDLLDEVTGLVEHPSVYVGGFDARFLDVPQECLILTMRQNQKYFPLFDGTGKLLPRFLIVSNMRVADPRPIVAGNERVVRPRLEDARFFYDQDRKSRLEARVPQLAKVLYHNRLGSQLERVERIQLLAGGIARSLGTDVALTERAAWLCKADLLSGMVGEFPELQGIMGRYYALHDGEPQHVAAAIEAHYRPRFAGDELPQHPVAASLALADKLESLSGLFAVGQLPTGEKDPFGLRRSALGVVRILVENRLPAPLDALLDMAFENFSGRPGLHEARTALRGFIYDRLRSYCADLGYRANEIEAVLSLSPARLDRVPKQLEAVRGFLALPEAESLAAANKRIGNILKQAHAIPQGYAEELLLLLEERRLAERFGELYPKIDAAYLAEDYGAALRGLAGLRQQVDAFFDKVMVMDKDARVRANRIGLLGALHGAMNRIADLSKLVQ
jgi:glycyl-tRNA synthetase beta chain